MHSLLTSTHAFDTLHSPLPAHSSVCCRTVHPLSHLRLAPTPRPNAGECTGDSGVHGIESSASHVCRSIEFGQLLAVMLPAWTRIDFGARLSQIAPNRATTMHADKLSRESAGLNTLLHPRLVKYSSTSCCASPVSRIAFRDISSSAKT